MEVGLEKVNSHERVSVKALLNSGAIGMFADKKFVERNGFRLEKLERPVRIRNMDGTGNSRGLVTHEIEVNVYYQGHMERMKLDVYNLGRTCYKLLLSSKSISLFLFFFLYFTLLFIAWETMSHHVTERVTKSHQRSHHMSCYKTCHT